MLCHQTSTTCTARKPLFHDLNGSASRTIRVKPLTGRIYSTVLDKDESKLFLVSVP